MAKRKRLTPARSETPLPRAPQTPLRAPIAHVAGEAATQAALEEVADAFQAAKDQGRLLLELPLEAIEADHLIRDRLTIDDDEMQSLMQSLEERGQQTPIEVLELAPGRYGLISGWRRVQALRQLEAGTVLAIIRKPDTAAEAYLAMVEENEIRVGLSYFERARIAAKAAELGLYPTTAKAVQALFSTASRAKRSKINSFVTLHDRLGDLLTFPTSIAERLGLALAARLDKDAEFAVRLKDRLRKAVPETPEAELSLLTETLADRTQSAAKPAPAAEEIATGVFLKTKAGRSGLTLTLSGKAVTPELQKRLQAWLKDQ
ncbi:chromosome partitioning protein ParB [Roseobacter cerasinus]|uniref:Chromosome partitioning protein ParB n=1 Tax=Roseobacter cerasinus TaxID=2602289 RepID=A0A640VZW4_9RHOB|nr:ParB N-terminal domain-containing protein [Roseobacter cerasinus]GFE52465.1 chromosome partitioning protein ParB [Roseobacter cerasinus]